MIVKIPNPVIDKKIFALYESKREQPREYLGPSALGHPCDRWLWLSFRWAVYPNFDGRMLKLFKRGHLEEIIIINDLEALGLKIENKGDDQLEIIFSSHFRGHPDGVITGGIPGREKTRALLSCKTFKKDKFEKLLKEGPPESHIIQENCYMHETKIDRTLYAAVCKDDDRMYFDWLRYDKAIAQKAIKRALAIVAAERLPKPMPGASPEWFECKWCAAYDFCHKTKQLDNKNVNCRTCFHSSPVENHEWQCALYDCTLPLEDSRNGCRGHVIHPDLVPWKQNRDKSTVTDCCYIIYGEERLNGANGEESRTLLSCETTQKIVKTFKGSVQI